MRACNDEDKVRINKIDIDIQKYTKDFNQSADEKKKEKILFSFTKEGKAAYISHINIMNVFERAFLRAGIELNYSEGFNPKPKLEFANPLSLGFTSEEEIAAVEILVENNIGNKEIEIFFLESMNKVLPEGLILKNTKVINAIASNETGKKVKSLMASYNGGEYSIICTDNTAAEKINKLLADLAGAESRIEDKEKHILKVVTYKNDEGKIINFFKFLKENAGYEHPFDYADIHRHKTYCSSDEIVNEGPARPLSYFEYYR